MLSPITDRLRTLEEAAVRRVQSEQAYAARFGSGNDPHQESLARDLAQVIEEHAQQEATLNTQFAEQRSEVETQHSSERDAAKAEHEATISRTRREARVETERVNLQHEDSSWVAASVLDDTAEESPKRQYDRIRATLAKTREQQQAECAAICETMQEIMDARGWAPDALPPPQTDAHDLEGFSAEFTDAMTAAQERLRTWNKLLLPRVFVGGRWLGTLAAIVALIGIPLFLLVPPSVVGVSAERTDVVWMAVAAGTAVIAGTLLLSVLYAISSMQLSDVYSRLHEHASAAQFFHERWSQFAAQEEQKREREYESLRKKREQQLQQQLERYESAHQQTLADIEQRLQTTMGESSAGYSARVKSLDAERDTQRGAIERQEQQQLVELTQAFEVARDHRQEELDRYVAALQQQQQQAWDELSTAWSHAVQAFEAFSADARQESEQSNLDWSELAKPAWTPPTVIPQGIRIGEYAVDLAQIEGGLSSMEGLVSETSQFRIPALLPFPNSSSLLLETNGQPGRREAVQAMQVALLRMLTRIPPAKLRLTIIDPVGLGESFSGFMHLADYDELLITSRIWTEMGHIEARLAELTEHMENVLQKYLRNEFATIEEYNHFAGEVAEPYHVLVVADFPSKFSEQAARRLVSIATSGPRCGVYLLMSTDLAAQMPNAFDLDSVAATANTFQWRDGAFHSETPELRRCPLVIDTPPLPETFTQIVKNVGEASKDIRRVEVSFGRIAPKPEEFWSKDSRTGIDIPLGRAGATKLQHLRLGKGTSQHMLVAGKTGSGKSTFFHALITNVCMHYSPEEVELYLVDFKKGVEFKAYAPQDTRDEDTRCLNSQSALIADSAAETDPPPDLDSRHRVSDGVVSNGLPHARVIAIESDREFGVSVLQRLDTILHERGDLFRAHNVQDIASYRDAVESRKPRAERQEPRDRRQESTAPGGSPLSALGGPPSLPRILLVIDEFQEFFVEDDRYSQQAALLLDRLVRQGRAFGVHVILGSQTLGGAYSLARSTLGQVAVRVALQCSEADAHLILSEENTAARLLTRPGEAIYNDANGMIEGNHPFQIAWLPDEERTGYLAVMQHFALERGITLQPPVVFEGNVPSDPTRNEELMALIAAPSNEGPSTEYRMPSPPRIWLGEAVDIGPPTGVTFAPQTGSNLLIVGADTGAATGILTTALIALAASPRVATRGLAGDTPPPPFSIFDGTPPGSSESELWKRLADAVPGRVRLVTPQTASSALEELTAERHRRDGLIGETHPPLFVFVAGVSKFRDLRKSEDDFSLSGFGTSTEDAAPDAGKQFADLIAQGPELGMHLLLWADSYSNVDRWFSRQSLREFELRIAFPMNATDSSNLIDSPAASKLGVHRALLYREETGTFVKFRPYGPPTPGLITQLHTTLAPTPLEVATDLNSFRVT